MKQPEQTAIGIDIGGGSIRAGLVCDGELSVREVAALPAKGEPAALSRVVRNLIERVGRGSVAAKPGAVGVGLPGIWDRGTGVMRKAVNLPGLVGVNLRDYFAACCGRPPFLDSDVNCAAWAQFRATPQASARQRVIYLSLGTGVGGAVILEGELQRHTNGGGGHFGFLCLEGDDRWGVTIGHAPALLSDFASGPALAHHAARELGLAAGERVETLGPRTLAAAARALSAAIRNLIAVYQPDVCLLGGGVVDHYPALVGATETEYRRHVHPLAPAGFQICAAALVSHDAGVIGAAQLALRHPEAIQRKNA